MSQTQTTTDAPKAQSTDTPEPTDRRVASAGIRFDMIDIRLDELIKRQGMIDERIEQILRSQALIIDAFEKLTVVVLRIEAIANEVST
jgi:hypothetical protein